VTRRVRLIGRDDFMMVMIVVEDANLNYLLHM